MTEITNQMKETTKAFMKILMSMNLPETSIKAITQMVWNKPEQMDKIVAYIKENPKATESQMLTKAIEISNYR